MRKRFLLIIVVIIVVDLTNFTYSQVTSGNKTMSIDNNTPGKNNANSSTNQNQAEEKVYCFGYACTRKAQIMTKEEQAKYPDGYIEAKIVYVSNVVEAIRNGKVYENPRTDLFQYWGSFFDSKKLTKRNGYYECWTYGWSDFQTVNNKREAIISSLQQKGFEVRYIDDFFVKQTERFISSEVKESTTPDNKKIQLLSSNGTTASKEKKEDFWNTPENKTTKLEAKKQDELKRKEEQQETVRQLENARQNPYVLNGVSNRDTVYENNIQLIQSVNPTLKDAVVTVSWTNSKTNQSTTLTGIDKQVTLNEGWNKFNIAVWVNNTPIKSSVTLYYSKNDSEIHNGTVTDKDGNIYKTVTIGTQTWMTENLRTTKYNDGTPIPNITDNSEWANQTEGAYCWYDNDISHKATYGSLYNFYTVVDSRKLCPTGWHTPTDDDWTTLTTYLGGESFAGGKLKAITHWESPNRSADNSSGFTAHPGGYRYLYGYFYTIGNNGNWWSATEYSATNVWYRRLSYNYASVYRYYDSAKRNGFSVRCVRD